MRVVLGLVSAALGACLLAASGCASEEPSTGVGTGGGNIGVGQGGGTTGGTAGPGGVGGTTAGGISGGGSVTPGATGGTVTAPPSNVCDVRTINAYEGAPDILIVLDRSASMTLYGRWNPSKQAVKTFTNDFGGLINFGLSSFPGQGNPCSAGKLEVPLMMNNGPAIGAWLDRAGTDGFTPTGPALTEALKTLGDRRPGLDTSTKPAYVVLVTDGEPTCMGIPSLPGLPFIDQLQQDNARAAVKALKDANIPTYVIGYQLDAMWQPLMNELATLGGTQTYRPAESADQLVTTFRDITKDVVKCSFELSEAPTNPRYVRVMIDQKSVALDSADGWVINGKTVTLQGGACSTLKDGKGHTLNAQVECTEVVLN